MDDRHKKLDAHLYDLLTKCCDSFVFVLNPSESRISWSPNAVATFPLAAEHMDITGGLWQALLHPDDLPSFLESLKRMENGQAVQSQDKYRLKTRHDGIMWAKFNGWTLPGEAADSCLCGGSFTDLTTMNTIDTVTNLRNNYDFRLALSAMCEKPQPFGLLVFGIDNFRRINDLYSYTFGDEVLGIFSHSLQMLVPLGTSLFRLDGDRFAFVYPEATTQDMQQYFSYFQKVAQEITHTTKNKMVRLSISGGICSYPENAEDADSLYKNAHIAMEHSKSNEKKHFTVFSDTLLNNSQHTMRLMYQLQEAVANQFEGFYLCYQPLILASTGNLYGCEALVRFTHTEFKKGVSPVEFIPLLEKSGLILETGRWIFETAVAQCAQWLKVMPDFQMSINVSYSQFMDPLFKFFVLDTLATYQVDPSLITLELTESCQVENLNEIRHEFEFFRSQGLKIAFDDFGTGYSSLGIFRALSVEELKIDRSFIERITYDVTDQNIVSLIIDLCHSMNMYVCVEGIETEEVDRVVKLLKPKLLQGYYYNKPLKAEEFFEQYWKDRTADAKPPALSSQHGLLYPFLKPAQPMSTEQIIDNAHAGIFQVALDKEFTFITCNEGYRRMIGYTAKQIDEKFHNQGFAIIHPDDADKLNEEVRYQLGKSDQVTAEFRIVTSEGEPIWVLATGSIYKNRDGSQSLIVVMLENDKNKKKQLTNWEAYKHNRRMLDNIPTSVKCVRMDELLSIVYASPGYLKFTGFTEKEINITYGGKYMNLIHPDDRTYITQELAAHIKSNTMPHMHYRLLCKNGNYLWVETISRICLAEEDNQRYCYSSIINISKEKHTKRHTANLLAQFEDAMHQWGDVLFEYSIQKKQAVYSNNFQDVFGMKPPLTSCEQFALIHPEDQSKILTLAASGKPLKLPKPFELRIKKKDGDYLWCSIVLNKVTKKNNCITGRICDIDLEKRQRDALLVHAQQDAVTKLLNKGATEERIRNLLNGDTAGRYYAMFIIDIDNFKLLNDSEGYRFGDTVLNTMASIIQSVFRESDIIGRIGGDEFMCFIEYAGGDAALVAERASILLSLLHQSIQTEKGSYSLSVSIGISLYPRHGRSFYALFTRADGALYQAKERGKNSYCIFTNP